MVVNIHKSLAVGAQLMAVSSWVVDIVVDDIADSPLVAVVVAAAGGRVSLAVDIVAASSSVAAVAVATLMTVDVDDAAH